MTQPEALTWWITGLPSSGKTTLAQSLAKALRERGEAACIIDGDELRAGLCHDLGFDVLSRAENVRRAANMARMLNANAIHAIVAMVSPSAHAREAANAIIGVERCREIHLSTPLSVCEARDAKGLYARARNEHTMQMTGVQAAYEIPLTPALRIDTSQIDPNLAVQQMLLTA
ncbi:MAG TPA: adenylyl-sulfate kinase [Pseudomonas sp.]|nr:adenylyl-sulfate kinase [Pseudomonas sp.]